MLARMNGISRLLAVACTALLLAGCGTMRSTVVVEPASGGGAPPPHTRVPGGSYQVVKGDTLYSIAFRNGVDFRDLAGWNGVAAPYTIWPGQVLRLSPTSTGPANSGGQSATPVVVATHPAPAQPVASAPAAPVFETVPAASSAAATAATATAAVTSTPVASAPAHAASTVVPVAGASTAAPTASAALPPPPSAPIATAGGSRSMAGVSWQWPASGALLKRFQRGDAIPGIDIAGNAGDPVRAAADGVVVYSGDGLVGYGELVIIKHNDSLLSAYGHNRKRMVTEGQRVKAGQQIAEMGSTGASRNELGFQIRKDGNPVDPLDYLPPSH
ncbi:MAG: peptidoglycan DD-metalloendopeptidase family protein [Rhodanobacter sp.]